jgi:hypothetical protein
VRTATAFCIGLIPVVAGIGQEPATVPSHADLAFEQKDWGLAVHNYQAALESDSLDGHAWLRMAQAQRALGLYAQALETLESAFAVGARGAMIEFERARNFANLGLTEDSLLALSRANENGLRALSSLEGAEEFKEVRLRGEFQEIYSAVRRRVFPCEGIAGSEDLDFWVGDWEVRVADGNLVGHSQVTRQDGGCAILEQWRGSGGSTGTSFNYFIPSLEQWRQVWVGSNGTLIDMIGGSTENGMRMEGTIEYVFPEQVLAFRGSWMKYPDGVVRQLLEEFDVASGGWQTWFDGYYRQQR